MSTPDGMAPNSDAEQKINEFRKQIDAIDDQIIALLTERCKHVQNVGRIKQSTTNPQCFIRPGREASMTRRIYEKFETTPFLPAAAAAIWRIIISMSTAMEKEFKVSVYAPDNDPSFYWLAREYFGAFTPIYEQYAATRVVGDVLDGKAAIGILPMPRDTDAGGWWLHLANGSDDFPKIFAHIPFVTDGKPGRNSVSALAIAKVAPEHTGNDVTYLGVEVEHNVSQQRLQMAIQQSGMDAGWLSVLSPTPLTRYHLLEVREFLTREDPKIQALLSELGSGIVNCVVLGSYATPIISNETRSHDTNRTQSKSASA